MNAIGVEVLSDYLKKARGIEIAPSSVSTAISSLEVDQDAETVKVCEIERRALAIVTHRWNMHNPEARMMNWIPRMEKSPPYDTPARHILSTFGIVELDNFEYLGSRVWVRKPIPATVMSLSGNKWIFEGYYRESQKSFSRLRETIWAIAMLPKSVVEEALNERHFLLVSEMIKEAEGNGEGQITAMAAITKGFDRVLVEDFSGGAAIKNYQEGYLERETPVVVLRYH